MQRTPPSSSRAGFTLLEMSIVLLIIGLLVGSIIVGQNMIRNSELNSVASDIQRYRTAFASFRLKYSYWPGDLPTAYNYWPNAGCTDELAISPPSNGCNGNGDDRIEAWNGSGTQLVEGYRAWQHLALSGITAGRFTGRPGPASSADDVLEINVPGTRLSGVGIRVDQHVVSSGYGMRWDGIYGNGFAVGVDAAATEELTAPFLSPPEAYSIDKKYDDGRPGTGKYRTRLYGGTCTDLTAPSQFQSAQYLLTYNGIACMFRVDL